LEVAKIALCLELRQSHQLEQDIGETALVGGGTDNTGGSTDVPDGDGE